MERSDAVLGPSMNEARGLVRGIPFEKLTVRSSDVGIGIGGLRPL
jgi:hypothetical protein